MAVVPLSEWVRRATARADVIGAWAEATTREVHAPPFQFDADFLAWLLPLMEWWSRYFDGEVRGLDRVPPGPVLLVGNHSGGVLVPDTGVLFAAWYRHFGLERPLVGLAMDAAFGIPWFGTLMRKIGEVPANPENAGRALAAGAAVLVYPGGAHEAFRPWTDRHRVDFDGHTGFVRLALANRVPVVPVVAQGGHSTTVILSRGEWIAQRLGLERLRLRSWPVGWQVPWGLSSSGIPGVPLPAKITIQVESPISWAQLGPDAANDPLTVRRCYDEITGVMQARLDALAAEHPYPILSRLRGLVTWG